MLHIYIYIYDISRLRVKLRRQIIESLTYGAAVCLSVCLYAITAASVPRALITALREVRGSKWQNVYEVTGYFDLVRNG